MDNTTIITVLIAFIASAILAPIIIPLLVKIKVGQVVRDDGPKTHLGKKGTPTMGGIIFLVPFTIVSLFFIKDNHNTIPVLILTVGFGIIGFIDDYIKVVLKRSKGLSVVQKLIGQIIITGVFVYYITCISNISLAMKIPFFEGAYIDLGMLNIPLVFIVVLATVNGANFTDGIDGLATSVTIPIAAYFGIVAFGSGSGISPIIGAMIGALMGFLLHNAFPAKIFMGDTGSLALGGFVVAIAYIEQMPLFILIACIIYVIELLSVVIQVTYFKISKGKRVFKMAPIHHHFELCGYSETRIVTMFTIITIISCLLLL